MNISYENSKPFDVFLELHRFLIKLLWYYVDNLERNDLNEIKNSFPDLYEFIKCIKENLNKPYDRSWRALYFSPVERNYHLKPSFDINCSVSVDQITYDKLYPTIHYFLDISVLGEDRIIYLGSCSYINSNKKNFFYNEKTALRSCLFNIDDEEIKHIDEDEFDPRHDPTKNYIYPNIYNYVKPFFQYSMLTETIGNKIGNKYNLKNFCTVYYKKEFLRHPSYNKLKELIKK